MDQREEAPSIGIQERYELRKFQGDSTDEADLLETVVVEDGRITEVRTVSEETGVWCVVEGCQEDANVEVAVASGPAAYKYVQFCPAHDEARQAPGGDMVVALALARGSAAPLLMAREEAT